MRINGCRSDEGSSGLQTVRRTRAIVHAGGGNAQAGVAIDGPYDAFQAGLVLCDSNRLGLAAYGEGNIHAAVGQGDRAVGPARATYRKCVVEGPSGSVRVDHGGRRTINNTT